MRDFATDLERYLWTGEASNAKLKRVFEQFKRWLRSVYNSLKDIKYVGNDGREHSVELAPELKEIFDHMFNSEELKDGEGLGVRSEKTNSNAIENTTDTAEKSELEKLKDKKAQLEAEYEDL